MSKPTALTAYPPLFLELVERFHRGETRITLYDHDERKLKALRFHFYGFRKAFVKAQLDKQYPCVNAISARIEDGPSLVFESVDVSALFEPLRIALDLNLRGTETGRFASSDDPQHSNIPQSAARPGPASTSAHESVLETYLSGERSEGRLVQNILAATDQVCGWPACACPSPAPTPCPRWKEKLSEKAED